jgi:hypothetical protein
VKLTLPSLVSLTDQKLQGLLAGCHLAAADDATVLVLDQILLLEATCRVFSGAVVDLRLGTNSKGKLGHLILLTAVFFCVRTVEMPTSTSSTRRRRRTSSSSSRHRPRTPRASPINSNGSTNMSSNATRYSSARQVSSSELADVDISYVAEMRDLVKAMAKGRFKTQPEVNRAMIGLRSYLLRFRRDFHGFTPEIKRFIDETIAMPVGRVTPTGMQYVGEGYLPLITEFEREISTREVDSILRK